MKFPVDLSLFNIKQHSPTIHSLQRSLGREDLRLHDYCIPVNPYYPTKEMFTQFRARLEKVLKFYPSSNEDITQVLARTLGLHPDTIVLANGSTELITWIDWLFVKESIAVPVPTFGRWTDQPSETGKQVHPFMRHAEEQYMIDVDRLVDFCHTRNIRALALCNPNNPTGALLEPHDAIRMIDELSDLDVIVVDESFLDFAD
jgi:histidinol-phosphate/aromatic aminotransferase/cobyric acid decarboxylase-like protein